MTVNFLLFTMNAQKRRLMELSWTVYQTWVPSWAAPKHL